MLHRPLPTLSFTLLLLASASGCGTYRVSGGGYRGLGEYRTGGDYGHGESQENLTEEEMRASRRRLDRASEFKPQHPFKMSWPVRQVRFNRGFKPQNDPKHMGVDLGGVRGALVLAAHEGVVLYVGRDFRGYGNMVIVEYDDQWATLYAHLDSFLVGENTVVAAGDTLGTMGATGHATGVHLHFELMRAKQPIDPLPFLTQRPQVVDKKNLRKKRWSSR